MVSDKIASIYLCPVDLFDLINCARSNFEAIIVNVLVFFMQNCCLPFDFSSDF